MALIYRFLFSAFTSIFTFFGTYFTSKVAIGTALVVVMVAATATLAATISSLASQVVVALDSQILYYIAMLYPVHFNICLSALASARIARWIYDQTMQYAPMFKA